jgi:hypothetical protein
VSPEGGWRDPRVRRKRIGQLLSAGAAVGIVVLVYFLEAILERLGVKETGLTVAFMAAVLSLLALTAFTVLYTASLVDELTTERNRPMPGAEVRTFRDPVRFATFRAHVVLELEATGLTEPVHCTSHCNLFAQPGGADDPVNNSLRAINTVFFQSLARLAMDSPHGGLRLLLQYKDVTDVDVKIETAERLRIWMDVCASRNDINLKREQFDVQHLLPASLKDYFVIEDRVFKTIRKTPASGGSTQFVYMRSPEIAQSYRDWLADVFSNGYHRDNAGLYTEDDEDLTALMKSQWTKLREAAVFKEGILKNDPR